MKPGIGSPALPYGGFRRADEISLKLPHEFVLLRIGHASVGIRLILAFVVESGTHPLNPVVLLGNGGQEPIEVVSWLVSSPRGGMNAASCALRYSRRAIFFGRRTGALLHEQRRHASSFRTRQGRRVSSLLKNPARHRILFREELKERLCRGVVKGSPAGGGPCSRGLRCAAAEGLDLLLCCALPCGRISRRAAAPGP